MRILISAISVVRDATVDAERSGLTFGSVEPQAGYAERYQVVPVGGERLSHMRCLRREVREVIELAGLHLLLQNMNNQFHDADG